jgi:hypothetical protein
MICLHFEDFGFGGFRLEDRTVDYLNLPELEELTAHYPEIETAVDKDGNIHLFTFEIWQSIEQLDDLLEDPLLSEIPGLYTVPELGVKNATFKEVLEAVKKYYEAKLSQKPAHTA